MAKGAALRAARDAALAPIGSAAAAALAVLAQQLADGQITEAEFVDDAQLQLGMSYAQAMQVAQQQAAQDYGIAVEDDPTDAAMARAAAQAGILAGLAGLITSGISDAQQSARVDFYAGTVTGAWENSYVGAITDMSESARFVWTATNDGATCDYCASQDGTEYTVDDLGGLLFPGDASFGAETDGCEGGENCRCTLEPNDVVVNSDETLAASGGTMTDTLTADIGPDGTPEPPSSFAGHAYLIPEGVRSGDGRQIAPGALVMGETPLPWMYKPVNSPEHDDAVVAGRIDTAVLQDNGMWYAQITFSDSDVGREAMAAAADQSCRFVSADVYGAESQVIVVQSFDSDGDDDGDVQDAYLLVTKGEIRGATQLPFPAFSGCTVAMAGVPLDDPDMDEMLSVTASGGPVVPPAAWFADPGFAPGDGRMVQDTRGNWACPLTVTDDGQVFGHIAAWRAQHIGYAEKVTPPRSKANYAYFRTGTVKTDDGDVAVGQLTMGCGHCLDDFASANKARGHYDGSKDAIQVCDVSCSEDDFGIWVAGAVRPGVTDEQIREFRSLAPSGDWRQIAGHLELVACVQVPVPGFPVPRALAAGGDVHSWPEGPRASMRDGELVSLVAAGRVVSDPLGARFARMEAEMRDLRGLVGSIARERLLARLAH